MMICTDVSALWSILSPELHPRAAVPLSHDGGFGLNSLLVQLSALPATLFCAPTGYHVLL